MLFLANIFGVETWLIVLVLALLLFGGKKIPELMRGVGKGVGELQKGIHEGKQSFHAAVAEETVPPTEINPISPPQTPSEATPRTTEP